jgi:hypothetical protein
MNTSFEALYRDVLALPDEEVRRVRLQGLEQALVDHLFDKGYLLARPTVQVVFGPGTPQGHPQAGARPEAPGQVVMVSDPAGRVASPTGCLPDTGTPDTLEARLIHRWTALFHELGHFTFDQLPARTLTAPLQGHLSPAGVQGIHEYVWAPFLANLERHRLNETFADVWAGAALLAWLGDSARPELEALRDTRRRARLASQQAWQAGDVAGAQGWVHLTDRALDRLLKDHSPPASSPVDFLAKVVAHAVQGTVERWRSQPDQACHDLGDSWCNPTQQERLHTALLHARQHHDSGLVETWLKDHPDHPWMRLTQQRRWTTPARVSTTAAWRESWIEASRPGLEAIHAAWIQADLAGITPRQAALSTSSVRRRRMP